MIVKYVCVFWFFILFSDIYGEKNGHYLYVCVYNGSFSPLGATRRVTRNFLAQFRLYERIM